MYVGAKLLRQLCRLLLRKACFGTCCEKVCLQITLHLQPGWNLTANRLPFFPPSCESRFLGCESGRRGGPVMSFRDAVVVKDPPPLVFSDRTPSPQADITERVCAFRPSVTVSRDGLMESLNISLSLPSWGIPLPLGPTSLGLRPPPSQQEPHTLILAKIPASLT